MNVLSVILVLNSMLSELDTAQTITLFVFSSNLNTLCLVLDLKPMYALFVLASNALFSMLDCTPSILHLNFNTSFSLTLTLLLQDTDPRGTAMNYSCSKLDPTPSVQDPAISLVFLSFCWLLGTPFFPGSWL